MNPVVPIALDQDAGLSLRLYERGCALLEQCLTFDETKYWDSLADAAQAWAKIHKSDRVEQLARALKLRAFRRLGEIAAMERPPGAARPPNVAMKGRPRGAQGWLEERGLDRNEAIAARMLARMPAERFEEIAGRPRPPMPVSVRKGCYSPWQEFYMRSSMANVLANTKRLAPVEAAQLEGLRDRAKIAGMARNLAIWFAEFAHAVENKG